MGICEWTALITVCAAVMTLASSLEDEEHEMDVLQSMRQAIREQSYRISSHANDEMDEDFLTASDVENIILTGEISRKFT